MLKRITNRNRDAFLSLVRAGLWEQDICLLPFGPIDFSDIMTLSEEQSVIGLVAAGIDHVIDNKPAKKYVLQFLGQALLLEQRNNAMNYFIGIIVDKMSEVGIHAVLVKGQGVARCYSKPQWRTSGDVDFFLYKDNYEQAIAFLRPLAANVGEEDKHRLHIALTVEPWLVELHGTMHTEISKRIDIVIDSIQKDIFENGGVRVWEYEKSIIYLPSINNDIVIIFTHFIDHFYVGGLGLRQICDWCRFLWTYREELDVSLVESRLKEMGLINEWKSFAFFAVRYLGMPAEAMPLYLNTRSYGQKARRILDLIMYTGNFGQNKDESYRSRFPRIVVVIITFFRRLAEFVRLTIIFPKNAPSFFLTYVCRRVKASL